MEEHQLASVVERGLERAELGVHADEALELGGDDVVAVAVEAVGVEDEAAEVAERKLAGAPEIAQATAESRAVAVARRRVAPRGARRVGLVRDGLGGDVELDRRAAGVRGLIERLVITVS